MNEMKIEQVGQRIYVTGNTYAAREQLKEAGCHWDSQRKQWWIGAAKADRIRSIVDGLNKNGVKEDLGKCQVYGKVAYTGKSGKSSKYFVIAISKKSDPPRLRLTNLMGTIDFWVDETACKWLRRYEGRQVEFRGYGNYRSNTIEYQTLADIQKFVRDSESARKKGYSSVQEMRAEKRGKCRGCGGPLVDARHHSAMEGYCGHCAFDEFDC